MENLLSLFRRDLLIHIAMLLLATEILEPAGYNYHHDMPAYQTAREVKFR